jgi:H+/Cl- antiporter ClcA
MLTKKMQTVPFVTATVIFTALVITAVAGAVAGHEGPMFDLIRKVIL